jgi:probable F420-dependent oxidoreductase
LDLAGRTIYRVKIRFAITPPRGIDQVADLERLGFDTVWLSDIPLGEGLDPILGLAAAAAQTSKLKLGANIVPFGRSPVVLAKSLAQLDQLSNGRLLLSFVVGLDQPGEREALGIGSRSRGRLLEEIVPTVRAAWADGSPARPVQDPLEIWFGGIGPAALDRTGRLADGWLGAAITPAEADAARLRIEDAASSVGRTVDPEHFGLSIPYAPSRPDPAVTANLRARRSDLDVTELVPVGPQNLRDLIGRYVDAGLSKFVIRQLGADADGPDALGRLADVVLPLQS